jgi:hypothetical protein
MRRREIMGVAYDDIMICVDRSRGDSQVGTLFEKVSRAEVAARMLIGAVFIAAGIFFTLRYTFDLF